MSLYERYELLDLDRDDGVKTFEAREIATGRPVKVHLFVHPGAPLQAVLLKAIDQLPEEERQRIIERGKHEGTPYLVTDRLVDYPGLSEWVQATSHGSKPQAGKAAKPVLETAGAWKLPTVPASVSAPAPAPAAAPTAPIPPASPIAPAIAASPTGGTQPDGPALNQQFVELFATAERPIVADSLVRTSQRPVSIGPVRPPEPVLPKAAVPSAPAQMEPGEFTRMFQSPGASTPAAPPQAPAQTAPAAKTEAGEFTQMFRAPSAPAPPPAKEPGEFTRMFRASPGAAAQNPAPPAPPASGAKTSAGDFDRLFETPSPAGPMPHSPAVQQPLTPQAPGGSGHNRVGEFTRTFGKGEINVSPGPPPAAPAQAEPGEFTRMFHSPGAAVPSPGAATPMAPTTPPAGGGATQGFSTPASAPPVVPLATGPGEYTRQFSAPAQLTFGQAAGTPPPVAVSPSPQAFAPPAMAQPAMSHMAQPPVAPRKTNLVLILGIVGMVVVAMLLVVFFAMRPK